MGPLSRPSTEAPRRFLRKGLHGEEYERASAATRADVRLLPFPTRVGVAVGFQEQDRLQDDKVSKLDKKQIDPTPG